MANPLYGQNTADDKIDLLSQEKLLVSFLLMMITQ